MPLWCQTPSRPEMPLALVGLADELTLSGGQNDQQPLALVHFGFDLLSPLSV
jgi:hypothetical protein